MSTSPSTLPTAANLVHVRAPRFDRSDPVVRECVARLRSLQQPAQWQAATLALMLAPGSRHERALWVEEARDVPDAARMLDDVLALPQPYRLPWFEAFARLLAPGPVELRHALIGAARRQMTSDGMVTQMDQLRWVALRHLLAGSAAAAPAAAETDLAELEDAHALKVCLFSAFLSHMVPAPELTLDLTGHESTGQTWYASVIAPWCDRFSVAAARASRHRRHLACVARAAIDALVVAAGAGASLVRRRARPDRRPGPAPGGRRCAAPDMHAAGFPGAPGTRGAVRRGRARAQLIGCGAACVAANPGP